MVKKLFKYEFISYLRTLVPFEIIILAAAVLTRFIQFFENDSLAYSIVSTSSIVAYVIAILVGMVMVFVSAITRFYKNLYTSEGYLTLTLPVNENQHIFVKLMTAMAFVFITFAVIFVSVIIASAGELCVEIFKAIGYLFKAGYDKAEINFVFYVIEGILLLFSLFAYNFVICYTCITIGQLAKKNRVLSAFGIYLAFYFATQILGTILIIVFGYNDSLISAIGEYISEHTFAFIHIAMIGITVICAVMTTVFLVIDRHIIKNKLNLE